MTETTEGHMVEPLVMLPGMFCDAGLFGAQLVALGRDGPVMVAPTTQFDRTEDAAKALLPVLPARFALCGQGLGGNIALEILQRAPERVTRIALMGTSAASETPQDAGLREPRMIAARMGRFDDAMAEEFAKGWVAPGTARAAHLATLAAMAKSAGPEAYVRQSRALQRRRDLQALLRRIRQPALVICGEHDGVTPARRQQIMAEMIPYGRYEVIGEAAHVPSLEQPQAVTALLRAWMRQPLVLR